MSGTVSTSESCANGLVLSDFDLAMLEASEMAYDPAAYSGLCAAFNPSGTPGWSADSQTGYRVAVAPSPSSHNLIVAFCGTADVIDMVNDAAYGWRQWENNRDTLMTFIEHHLRTYPDATIHFTGHSLGGALAQYAAHEISHRGYGSSFTLTTFNALGGVHALRTIENRKKQGLLGFGGSDTSREASFSAVAADHVYCRHYATDRDLISRLGGGHLGGSVTQIKSEENMGPLSCHLLGTIKTLVSREGVQLTSRRPHNTRISNSMPEAVLGAGLAISASVALGLQLVLNAEKALRAFAGRDRDKNAKISRQYKTLQAKPLSIPKPDTREPEAGTKTALYRVAEFVRDAVWRAQAASVPLAIGTLGAAWIGVNFSGLVAAQYMVAAGLVSAADFVATSGFQKNTTKIQPERTVVANLAGLTVHAASVITVAALDLVARIARKQKADHQPSPHND